MTAPTISAEQAIRERGGTECRGCGGTKKTRMSHCRKCYFALPRALQGRLYRLVGDGYEEAYAESLAYLKSNGTANDDARPRGDHSREPMPVVRTPDE